MRYCIVLVVYDPRDAQSRACALPEALRSVESLHGDFSLIVTVNAAERCPRTVAFLRAWSAEREWAHLRLHRSNHGIAAAFNASVHGILDDYDAFVFMSGDALLVDPSVLHILSDAFTRWPAVGALHPVSVFEDAEAANYSPKWDVASFRRVLQRYAVSDVVDPDGGPSAPPWVAVATDCTRRRLQVTRPHLVLPLTFWAVRRAVLQVVGPLDERWLYGYENMDFALRAYLAGAQSAVVQNTFVFHRRLLYRLLGSMEVGEAQTSLGLDGQALWLLKWGRPPGSAFDQARFGPTIAGLLGIVRRAGGSHLPVWRAASRRRLAALRRLVP